MTSKSYNLGMSGSSVITKKRRSRDRVSEESIKALIQRIRRGFNFGALTQFSKQSGLSLSILSEILQIPQRTLARRKIEGRLRPEESERLLRISTLFERAVELFEGDVPAARTWLTRPARALDYEQPLTYAQTEVGAREVEHLIGRLEDGVFT